MRSEFIQRGKEFPKGAEDTIRQRFDYRVPYAEMERRRQEDQLVADMLGSGQVMRSLSDEIMDDLKNPKSEIMDIDMTEYATTNESVIPPEIIKFQERKQGSLSRFGSFFKRIFGRR